MTKNVFKRFKFIRYIFIHIQFHKNINDRHHFHLTQKYLNSPCQLLNYSFYTNQTIKVALCPVSWNQLPNTLAVCSASVFGNTHPTSFFTTTIPTSTFYSGLLEVFYGKINKMFDEGYPTLLLNTISKQNKQFLDVSVLAKTD